MRYTNIQLLQKVSRAINSDEVDRLDETLESLDILDIMERTLGDILSRRHWNFMKNRYGVCTDGANVITVTLPTQLVHAKSIRYNTDTTIGTHKELVYLDPQKFIQQLQANDKSASNTDTVTIDSVELYPRNDKQPQFYTSFDELTIVVDSYDSSVDASGVTGAKTSVLGTLKPVLDFDELTSTNVTQNIPEQMHNYWLWETIAVASFELRQIENARAERSARRAYVRLLDLEPMTEDSEDTQVSYGRCAPSRRKVTKRV